MKILVDELPCNCGYCLFAICTRQETDRYVATYKCKITDNEQEAYSIPRSCPLESLDGNLEVGVDQYDEWDARYNEITIKFKDKEIYNDKKYIGSSGWRDE